VTPGKPGGRRARAAAASAADGSEIARERQRQIVALCRSLPQNRTCAPFVASGNAPAATSSASNVRFEGAWARRALGLYTCADWRRAGRSLRTKLLARLAHFTGGRVNSEYGSGTVLTAGRAAAMFDSRCKPRYARSFALYKLYGRAAAFAGGAP